MKKTGMTVQSPRKRYALSRHLFFIITCLSLLLPGGCATVGHDFPVDQVKNIQVGKTTKKEISSMFGNPWRTGLEDGRETWSYGQYQYRMFSEKDAKDLVVRFTDDDIVESYTFNINNR